MRKLALLFAAISAQLGTLHFFRVRSGPGIILYVPKTLAATFAPFLALFGLLGAALGLLTRTPFAVGAGLFGLAASARYVWRVVSAAGDFDAAFGPGSLERITPAQEAHMLGGRWTWRPAVPPEPRFRQDVPFWTLPGGERTLLCDIWEPPAGVTPSGLGFIYLHGSGWHFMDKDFGTRPMFRRLAAQGHVIMDISYRLCPETDWRGMQGDAKRAVAWLKAHAAEYGVDPRRVVLAGGSAGGHLALLAAYTADDPDLLPVDIDASADLRVSGVVSWYGPSDLVVFDEYAGPKFAATVGEEKTALSRLSERMVAAMGIDTTLGSSFKPGCTIQESMMRALLGGTLSEVPDAFRLGSPVTHVGPHCPPTLLLQGADDFIVQAEAVAVLADRLREAGVPVVHVEYPQTDHAFDLLLPQLSPAAQAALYEAERFLALLPPVPEKAAVELTAMPEPEPSPA